MITITSKNRTQARKLLNNWHSSTDVRTWPLSHLQTALGTAIYDGLISEQAAERALGVTSKPPVTKASAASDNSDKVDGNTQRDPDKVFDGDGFAGVIDDDVQQAMDALKDAIDKRDANQTRPTGDNGNDEYVTHEQLDEVRRDDKRDAASNLSNLAENIQEALDTRSKNTHVELDTLRDDMRKLAANTPKVIEVRHGKTDVIKIDKAHMAFEQCLQALMAGENIALVGPAGVGKTYLSRQLAVALKREYRSTGAIMSKYDLIGFEDQNHVYQETALYQAYVYGHLFTFDEMDASASEALVAFNGVTDNQPDYQFPNGIQKRHVNFQAIACTNTNGLGATSVYTGRAKLDGASTDRFTWITLDYDEALELSGVFGDVDIAERVQAIRKATRTLRIEHVVSSRMIQRATSLRAAGWSTEQVESNVYYRALSAEAIEQITTHMGGAS